MKLNKYLIFMLPYPPSTWDAKRFGFQALLANGIHLKVFDMSNIILTRSANQTDLLQASYITKISSYVHFENEVCHMVNGAVYIDEINGLNGFQWQGRKIFRIFKKYNIPYYLVEIGALPILTYSNTKHFILKIKKMFNFKKLFAYAKWRLGKWIVNCQMKFFNHYQLPIKIFVSHTDLLDWYLRRYQLSPHCVVPIHSFDYDRYILYGQQVKPMDESRKKTGVFLDQALAYHGDFGKAVSFSPVTSENYIRSMNRFFDKLECETGLEVIIAASPRSKPEYIKKMFGNRTVIKDKTLELVAQSSLVLMHSSTAVSFAVLFNKPILVLKTDQMVHAHGYGNFLDNMAAALKLKPLLIDQQNELEKINLSAYEQWEKNYTEYKYKYIMTKELANKTTWEIVTDIFQR